MAASNIDSGDLVAQFEKSCEALLNLLVIDDEKGLGYTINNHGVNEDSQTVETNEAMEAFIDIARKLDTFFLQNEVVMRATESGKIEAIKEATQELKTDLERKNSILKNTYEFKIPYYQKALENICGPPQEATTVQDSAPPADPFLKEWLEKRLEISTREYVEQPTAGQFRPENYMAFFEKSVPRNPDRRVSEPGPSTSAFLESGAAGSSNQDPMSELMALTRKNPRGSNRRRSAPGGTVGSPHKLWKRGRGRPPKKRRGRKKSVNLDRQGGPRQDVPNYPPPPYPSNP